MKFQAALGQHRRLRQARRPAHGVEDQRAVDSSAVPETAVCGLGAFEMQQSGVYALLPVQEVRVHQACPCDAHEVAGLLEDPERRVEEHHRVVLAHLAASDIRHHELDARAKLDPIVHDLTRPSCRVLEHCDRAIPLSEPLQCMAEVALELHAVRVRVVEQRCRALEEVDCRGVVEGKQRPLPRQAEPRRRFP